MTKKVLLIEDDVVLRENTAELLELSDYDVITASNGKIGVEKAINEHPDVIVCDIMMPEMDGYDVLSTLSNNELTKFIPFIFLSAKTERQDVRKGMNMGADDYITKPFNEEELVSAIESRLAKVSILKDFQRAEELSEKEKKTSDLRTLNDLKVYFEIHGKAFDFQQGDLIYDEGQNSNYIFLVRSGVVKCHKFDEQGKELTTALYNTSDIFGYTSFTQNIPYQETSTAIRDVQLFGLSKDQLKQVLDTNQNVTLELIQMLTDDLKDVKDQLLQMAYSSVKKKTASTILKFAEKLSQSPGDAIKISRSDLASVAGIATETLIRCLSDFKKEGMIDIEGRNIKILDIQELQEVY